jgi:hypothetical protein
LIFEIRNSRFEIKSGTVSSIGRASDS